MPVRPPAAAPFCRRPAVEVSGAVVQGVERPGLHGPHADDEHRRGEARPRRRIAQVEGGTQREAGATAPTRRTTPPAHPPPSLPCRRVAVTPTNCPNPCWCWWDQAGCRTCFLGNLAWSVEEENVTELFSQCGTIQQVRFATDRETGDFKGFGALPTPPLCSPFTIWAAAEPSGAGH